jgi:hypothetical protein
MENNFDSWFLFSFGLISLLAGIFKKNILFWVSIKTDSNGNKSIFYKQVINITMGIISIAIGILLYKN